MKSGSSLRPATTLCFDFGNTRLKCAVFFGRELKEVVALESDQPEAALKLIDKVSHSLAEGAPLHSILSSVVNHPPELESLLRSKTRFHKLGPESLLPFHIKVGKASDVGADRLALCAAAVDLLPKEQSLTIAVGSCITFNFIDRSQTFIGGSISPGMRMRFRSMNEHTALLPLIDVKSDSKVPLVGHDTETNLLSGVILGMAKEIDGVIAAYKKEKGPMGVFFTGGDAELLMPFLESGIKADPDLLFRGLRALSEKN